MGPGCSIEPPGVHGGHVLAPKYRNLIFGGLRTIWLEGAQLYGWLGSQSPQHPLWYFSCINMRRSWAPDAVSSLLWLRSIKYRSLGGKAEWRYSGLKVLMKSYLKLLFKCNINRGVITGYLAERVECGPSNHVVGGSIPCTVTFFFSFFLFSFFLLFFFFKKIKKIIKKKKKKAEKKSDYTGNRSPDHMVGRPTLYPFGQIPGENSTISITFKQQL